MSQDSMLPLTFHICCSIHRGSEVHMTLVIWGNGGLKWIIFMKHVLIGGVYMIRLGTNSYVTNCKISREP